MKKTKKRLFKPLLLVMLLCVAAIASQEVWSAESKRIPFRVNYIRPAEEAVKVRDVTLSTNLEFKSSSTVLDLAHGTNRSKLRHIDSLMSAIVTDPAIALNGISIAGYSSPEGMYLTNEILSKGRAASVKNYLTGRYATVAERMYQVSFGGENWDGLYEMVLNSETPEKARVLSIIEEVDIMKGREAQLMELARGVPYRYLLKNFFPSLRKVDVTFNYNIRNFDLVEAEEVYNDNPNLLSLAEIYNVASQHPQDSDTFRQMMISSANLYPKSDVANLNAAVAASLMGDNEAAAHYLARVNEPTTGEYYNVSGVNRALSNRIDEAIESLEKGVAQLSSDAEYNLLLLRKPETVRETVRDTVYIRDTIYQKEIQKIKTEKVDNSPWLALKTNLVYWGLLQPNVEAEFYFAQRWSVNLEYQVAWWSNPSKHQYYQYMHMGIEGRFWLKRDGSFSGHHLGLFAGGGYYDLSAGRVSNTYEGYQGEFAVAAGLSYGYAWKLNRSLWMETGIGVGFVRTQYRKYNYQDTHYVCLSTERLQFFGPTKLRLSLIWRPQFKSRKNQ